MKENTNTLEKNKIWKKIIDRIILNKISVWLSLLLNMKPKTLWEICFKS